MSCSESAENALRADIDRLRAEGKITAGGVVRFVDYPDVLGPKPTYRTRVSADVRCPVDIALDHHRPPPAPTPAMVEVSKKLLVVDYSKIERSLLRYWEGA